MNIYKNIAKAMLVAVLAISCSNKNNFDMGSYGYDARFLKENGIH